MESNFNLPPPAEIETITVEEYRSEHAAAVAQEVLLEAEQAIRNLGDCGGGRALAQFVMALADGSRRFCIQDLCMLDLENSDLVARLFREYMVGKRSPDEWQSLAELAQRIVFPDEKLYWQY